MADPTNETKTPGASDAAVFAEYFRDGALTAIDHALWVARALGNDAAEWDLVAARKRLEKTDD